jgi:hypothetical protein
MLNLVAESVRLSVRRNRLLDQRTDIKDGIAKARELTAFRLNRCAALQRRVCRSVGGLRSN